MEIQYKNKNIEEICTNFDIAKKEYNPIIAKKINKALNFIKSSKTLKDVICHTPFGFHDLQGKRKGQYSIYINGKQDKHRLILKPLDQSGNEYKNLSIDKIANITDIVLILEVSKHYEK